LCFLSLCVILGGSMDKTQYNKEVSRILTEARKLEEKAKLDLETAIFFDNKAKELESILDDPNSTQDQIDNTLVELAALNLRIQVELREGNEEAIRIERELLVLNNKSIMDGLI
jgi:hypothetical protein